MHVGKDLPDGGIRCDLPADERDRKTAVLAVHLPVPVCRDAAFHDDPHDDAAGFRRDECRYVLCGRSDICRRDRCRQQYNFEKNRLDLRGIINMYENYNRDKMLELSKKASEATAGAFEAAAEVSVKGYKVIETSVIKEYKTVENAAVGTYTKIEDKFIDRFLKKDGETLEEAKKQLKKKENMEADE